MDLDENILDLKSVHLLQLKVENVAAVCFLSVRE